MMAVSDWLGIVALIISSGALALEIRRWVESGPRLHLRVMADAVEVPSDDDRPMLALFVTNRGSEPTTITNMVALEYPSFWAKFCKRSTMQGVVNATNVPAEVGVNRQWMGKLYYNEKLTAARAGGRLYIGVVASHSGRRYLLRVPAETTNVLDKQKPAG